MSEETIFSKIINKEIPADIVYEDNDVLAFKDINPIAPVHVLVIPKVRINSLASMEKKDVTIVGTCLYVAKKIADELNLSEDGYRVVTNTGNDGGQSVSHIHFHLIGGRKCSWPPG